MTFEHHIVVGIEDIKYLSLECNKCKVRLTYSPDDIREIPMQCPNPGCRSEWQKTIASTVNERAVPMHVKLLNVICAIRKRNQENAVEQPNGVNGFRILLEFEKPSERAIPLPLPAL